MPKSRNRRKKTDPPISPKGTVVPISDATHAALLAQRAAFIEKFGREPGPTDPVFFDPSKDVPTQMSGSDMRQQVTETMRKAGIDEAKIAAFLKVAVTPSKDPADDLSEAEYEQASRYSHQYPAFKSTFEFDLTFQMLGNRVTRKAKAKYTFTPEWEYYDLNKMAPHVGWESASYHVEVEAVPQEYHDDGTVTEGPREWVKMGDLIEDGILPHEVWDVLLNAIDQQCKAEDAKRRQAAKKKLRR